MFTMFFLVKLTIAIVIVCGILSPILASPHNKLSTLFWKIPNAFWIFLICIYFAIAMVTGSFKPSGLFPPALQK